MHTLACAEVKVHVLFRNRLRLVRRLLHALLLTSLAALLALRHLSMSMCMLDLSHTRLSIIALVVAASGVHDSEIESDRTGSHGDGIARSRESM